MTPPAWPCKRPLSMSPFEEAAARLRDSRWDAADEAANDRVGDDEFMAKYDRRGLLLELDAARLAAAGEAQG